MPVAPLKRDGRAKDMPSIVTRRPRGRVTWLVDFLADTTRSASRRCCDGSMPKRVRRLDKIRRYAAHGFRRVMRRSGYFQMRHLGWRWRQNQRASPSPPLLYKETDDWHVTLGDSDQDR
jgi:hypothetical protein